MENFPNALIPGKLNNDNKTTVHFQSKSKYEFQSCFFFKI